MLPRINPGFTSFFTYAAVIAGIFLILRRTFIAHVFAVSSWRDYAAMVCVLTPFVTGILAGRLTGLYETVIVIHCASAHVLLLAFGWTRLGHMVFFASGRLVTLGLIKGDDV
jgi:nitrate reductase gamma subunit